MSKLKKMSCRNFKGQDEMDVIDWKSTETMKVSKKDNLGNIPISKFTERQRSIVRAWAKYPTIAQASKALDISEHTFQTHLRRMRKKINVSRTFDVYDYLKKHELL